MLGKSVGEHLHERATQLKWQRNVPEFKVNLFSVCKQLLCEISGDCGQVNCLVKLADVSTICSSHPQGKSKRKCEMLVFLWAWILCMRFDAEAEALARLALAQLTLPLVPS